MPREGTDFHAEQRMQRLLAEGEVIIAQAPTRGVCPECQGVIDLSTVPAHRQTPEAYNAWRAVQVQAGLLPAPSRRRS
jgi:hypothetical protein